MSELRLRALSRELRTGSSPYLRDRRATVSLSLIAMGSLAAVSLYQMGIIRHLPEPPLPRFDADAVDAAPEAYATLAMPDGVLGLVSYAVTAALAAAGSYDRSDTRPALPLALAAKVGFDAAISGKLTLDQWTKHKAWCFWCLTASAATLASVPRVVPEARAALKSLRESS
ncbi:MAG: vitamin K epoxide reductase family protein [Thermomicrobiales bacterium]